MTAFTYIAAAVLGASLGSFCNVVIYRLKAGDSPARGRSYCPKCRHELAAIDLVPIVSWLALRGRCRYCHQPISKQYPAVELAMAGLAWLMVWRFGLSPEALVGIVLSAFFLIIFVYDLKHQLILDRVSLPAAAIALGGSLLIGRPVLSVLLGGLVGSGFFLAQYVLSRGRWIGGGDIRLGLVLGFALGWPLVLVCLVVSYLGGALVVAPMLLARRRSWSSLIPFGTFLTVGGVITFVWGNTLLDWYLRGGFFDFVVQFIPDQTI